MTLPSSGPIAINDVNIETGRGSGATTGIDWIRDHTKDSVTDLNSLYGRSWYQRNQDGNCDNGNCGSGSSSGNIQCQNCSLSNVNCANCDAQAWLQPGVNCACTYNCTQNTDQTYACNCACACACACFICACACW